MSSISRINVTDNPVEGWINYFNGKSILKISKSNLTDEHMIDIAEALKTNTVIKYLDLSHNKVTDNGAKVLSEALRVNKSLATNPLKDSYAIKLNDNPIGKDGIIALIKTFNETNRYGHCIVMNLDHLTAKDIDELVAHPEVIEFYRKAEPYRNKFLPKRRKQSSAVFRILSSNTK